MAAFDIAELLFREILRMNEYPGAPFTGDLIRDIVTYFFVPTVFLIAVIYFATGIMFGPSWRGFRLLFGLAGFMFVIVSGYFSVFAYIAGPYFFFLIIVVGLVYFIARHFRRPTLSEGGGGPAKPLLAEHMRHSALEIQKHLREIEEDINRTKSDLDKARSVQSKDEAALLQQHLMELRREKIEMEKELAPWRRYV